MVIEQTPRQGEDADESVDDGKCSDRASIGRLRRNLGTRLTTAIGWWKTIIIRGEETGRVVHGETEGTDQQGHSKPRDPCSLGEEEGRRTSFVSQAPPPIAVHSTPSSPR